MVSDNHPKDNYPQEIFAFVYYGPIVNNRPKKKREFDMHVHNSFLLWEKEIVNPIGIISYIYSYGEYYTVDSRYLEF